MSQNSQHPFHRAVEAFTRDLHKLDRAAAFAIIEDAHAQVRVTARVQRLRHHGRSGAEHGGSLFDPAAIGELQAQARKLGYEGDACPECQNFTLVRNGTCSVCETCGAKKGFN